MRRITKPCAILIGSETEPFFSLNANSSIGGNDMPFSRGGSEPPPLAVSLSSEKAATSSVNFSPLRAFPFSAAVPSRAGVQSDSVGTHAGAAGRRLHESEAPHAEDSGAHRLPRRAGLEHHHYRAADPAIRHHRGRNARVDRSKERRV